MMNGIGNSCGYSSNQQQQQQQQQQPPLIIIKSVCNKCRCCSSHNDDDEDDDEGDYQKIRSGIYPPGYTFKPDDVDVINCYLKKKIMNEELPHNEVMKNIILEVNLYDFNPDQLAEEYCKQLINGKKKKETCYYFFTPRNRKFQNANIPTRLAGDGFWSTSYSKAIKEKSDGPAIGLKTVLVWYKGKAKMKANKTDWIMYEYTCKGHRRKRANANDMMLDEWVLCEIHKSGRSGTNDGAPRAEENTVVASGQSYEPFNDQGGVMIGTNNNNNNNDTVTPNPIERLMDADPTYCQADYADPEFDQYVTSNLQVGVVDPEFDQTYCLADYAENEYLTIEDLGLI